MKRLPFEFFALEDFLAHYVPTTPGLTPFDDIGNATGNINDSEARKIRGFAMQHYGDDIRGWSKTTAFDPWRNHMDPKQGGLTKLDGSWQSQFKTDQGVAVPDGKGGYDGEWGMVDKPAVAALMAEIRKASGGP